MRIKTVVFALCILTCIKAFSQDTTVVPNKDTTSTDISKLLDEQMKADEKSKTEYVTATFKTTRLLNGHSVENTGRGVMDFKLSHRFDYINEGIYEMFGLDRAKMRIGLDFGITDNFMLGFGRSTLEKTIDGFFKYRILRQSTGKRNMPFTLSYVPTIAIKTDDSSHGKPKHFSDILFFTHQLIIGRKFSDGLSLQLMPSIVHKNIVDSAKFRNDILAIGIGGRQKLTKRTTLNIEYYYQLPGHKIPGNHNALSIGFDIETGGHVFQLHLTNSRGMNEKTFISETMGSWTKGDISFGFNISRVFNIAHKKTNKKG